jgi:hypothetical protein
MATSTTTSNDELAHGDSVTNGNISNSDSTTNGDHATNGHAATKVYATKAAKAHCHLWYGMPSPKCHKNTTTNMGILTRTIRWA